MPLSTSIAGLTLGPRVFDLKARQAMAYAAATGDLNPAYFDDTRAGGVVAPPMFGVRLDWPLRPFGPGMAGIILHGTATHALAAREILNREAGGDPARLARLACRFGAMVIPGTPIRIRATGAAAVEGGRAVFFSVETAEGGPAIRDGVAIIRE